MLKCHVDRTMVWVDFSTKCIGIVFRDLQSCNNVTITKNVALTSGLSMSLKSFHSTVIILGLHGAVCNVLEYSYLYYVLTLYLICLNVGNPGKSRCLFALGSIPRFKFSGGTSNSFLHTSRSIAWHSCMGGKYAGAVAVPVTIQLFKKKRITIVYYKSNANKRALEYFARMRRKHEFYKFRYISMNSR